MFDVSAPPTLQWFESSYNTIEQRAPDIFAAGYGAVLTPPPGRADSGNQSVGYDVYNRFDLGGPGDPTLYGTEAGLKAMVAAIHQTGASYYSDLVWNHDGFENLGTPGFAASGGYPGFALTLNPSNNYAGYNDIDGDFHSAFDNSTTGMRLSGLDDIAQEKNYQFIRNPVAPNNPLNLPAGTTPLNGRLANVPDPNNAQFYPDRNLPPITVNDPATGEYNLKIYPFDNADPLAGTPTPENALGYLMRYTQWMVQTIGVDGFRLDAAKNMPPWVLNYYDQAVYDSSFRTLLNGSQEPIFGFSEVFDGDKSLLQQYVNKSDNGPNTVGGNRDVLDFPLFFALQNNLTGNGYQNNWYNVVNASIDSQDDGLANNGSEGVSFVSSADNGPPYLNNVAYAYTLTHPGNTIVYFNGHEFGDNRSFPQDGRGDALGGLYGDTITNLVNIRDTHPDGNYDQRYIDSNVLVYERDDSMLIGLSNRTDSGYDNRWVQTDFAPGTYLVDLTGLSAKSGTNEDGNIHPLLQVGAGGWVNLNVPRNSDDGNFTGDGYVIYAPASPQGALTINGMSNIIPGGTPTAATNGTTELSPVDVVTGNNFQIQLNTNNVNLLGNPALHDQDADGDNALYKIDGGVDAAGTGFVDTNPGDVAYGFQQFTTTHNPGYFSADGNGEYVQTINTANLTNGYHYIDVRAFRHRNPGEPPIFTDFKVTIYVDHSPTTTQLVSFNDVTPGVNQDKLLTVEATDPRVNNVHVLFDLPAGLTDAQILAMIGGANQANQIDRDLWTIEDDGLTSGNHVATVVSYQIDGTASIERFDAQQFPALSTSTIYGAGLGDLDFNGQIDAHDVALFGQMLESDNQQFNPAADFNGDGQIDNSDFLSFYSKLQADHADATTLAAYQQLLGPPPGGYTIKEGTNLTLALNQPSSTTPSLSFSWSFNGDGNFADAKGPSPMLTWEQLAALGIDNEGTYPITLEVTDGTNTIQIPTTLAVQLVPPTLSIAGPGIITEGETYTLGLSASEPGGDVITGWSVDWGDGATQTLAGNATSATHIYSAPPNAVTISATATDEDGTYTADALPVAVDDAPLTASALTLTSVEGATFNGTVASFTDANALPRLSTFSATIDWGDGMGSTSGTVVANAAGGFDVQGTHVYAEEGTLPVTVTIDDTGGNQATAVSTANVSDPAVIATANAFTAAVGSPIGPLVVATFTDPGDPESLSDYQAVIDWGDGTATDVGAEILRSGSTFSILGTHLYAATGLYPVKVTIAHDSAPATTATTNATVEQNVALVLLDTASASLNAGGNASVRLTGGGAAEVLSSASAAVVASGNANIAANEIDVEGSPGIARHGNASISSLIESGLTPAGDPLLSDPFASLAPPTVPSTTFAATNIGGNTIETLQQGVYPGGISIAGNASVTLAPGVYYLQGGGFSVSGNAHVTGQDVLIYYAPQGGSDAVRIAGQAVVQLSGRSEYGGLAIYQDRASTAPIAIGGEASLVITGGVYAASGELESRAALKCRLRAAPRTA
ncbi:MAG TPA: dockerin type I domain-containing protein [Pirellulales bacterium]